MGRQVPWSEIPDSSTLPSGVYNMQWESVEERKTNEGDRLMYAAQLRVVEPEAFGGLPYYENFVIGTPDDPNAEDPDTWKASVGARIMKRAIKASGIELVDDIDETIAALNGQQVVVQITQTIDDGARDPRYKGRVRNQSVGWYALGERETGLEVSTTTAASKPTTKPSPKPAKSTAPAPRQAPAPAQVPVPRPAQVPVPSPIPKPAPKQPAPKQPIEKTLTCTLCDPPQQIPKSQFGEHVESHEE